MARANPAAACTDAQERFCQGYVIHQNATDAYADAYPKAKRSACAAMGSALLRNPKVSTRVKELQEAIAKRNGVSADRVMREMAVIAFSDIGEYLEIGSDGSARLDFSKIPKAGTRAISEFTQETVGPGGAIVKTRIKLHPKTTGLEQLAKVLGIYAPLKVDVRDIAEMTDDELAEASRRIGLD